MTDSVEAQRGRIRKITLVVEGFHDASTIESLFRSVCVPGVDLRIDQLKGLPRPANRDAWLDDFLRTRLNEPGVNAVGLIVDADDDLCRVTRRLQRLSVLNDTAREEHAERTPHDGQIAQYRVGRDVKRFGVWIMPDNRQPGQLEDFVLRMIPDADPVEQLARNYIGELPDDLVDNASHKAAKHIAHAWLSAYYPGWSFNDALRNGQLVFFADDPVLSAFNSWLKRLTRVPEDST